MPYWKPATKDGKPVKSLVLTSVSFKNVQDNVLIGACIRDAKSKKYLKDVEVAILSLDSMELSKAKVHEIVRGSGMYRFRGVISRRDQFILKVSKPGYQTVYKNVSISQSESQKQTDDIILKPKS